MLALCELHLVPIVFKFPPGCALGAPNPLEVLYNLEKRAFDASSRFHKSAEIAEAVFRHAVADQCRACVTKNLTEPFVQRLRRRTYSQRKQPAQRCYKVMRPLRGRVVA